MSPQLYAQFDGDEIDGQVYRLGDSIKADTHDAGTLAYLKSIGRIAATRPAMTFVVPVDDFKPVGDMTRMELEQAATGAVLARMAQASDDQLKDAIESHREQVTQAREDAANDQPEPLTPMASDGDDNSVSTADYDAIKDRPLYTLKTADLALIAEHENVSIVDAHTKADRITAIEDARKSRAAG